MIQRIERAAGALLIAAGVIILIGVGLSVAKPGGLGGDDKNQSAASTSTSDTSSTVTTSPASTTEAPSSTAPPTSAAQAGGTTSTTAGSGLGTSGSGSAGQTPIVNTGGPVWAPPLGAGLLALAVVARRLRRHPA